MNLPFNGLLSSFGDHSPTGNSFISKAVQGFLVSTTRSEWATVFQGCTFFLCHLGEIRTPVLPNTIGYSGPSEVAEHREESLVLTLHPP